MSWRLRYGVLALLLGNLAIANEVDQAVKHVGKALARTDIAQKAKEKVLQLDYINYAATIAPMILNRVRMTTNIGDYRIRAEINRRGGFGASATITYEY